MKRIRWRSASGDPATARSTAAMPPAPVVSGLRCATSGSRDPMREVSCQPMAALGAMLGRGRGAASFRLGGLAAGAAVVIGIAVGAGLALPSYQLVFAGAALSPALLALFGPELCISVLLIAAMGAMPFVNADTVAGGLPVWFIALG